MRSFIGVFEVEASAADDSWYMAPGGMDDDDEDEALAMQQMEKNCQNLVACMVVDFPGKSPSENRSPDLALGGVSWGAFVESIVPLGVGKMT
mmetsp:Transcript_40337/g.66062  ORF Transcript_40337/g.66062 Transcript_40337/m.66062 type:complete len:92 (+) Transcript_40337:145-420(+)